MISNWQELLTRITKAMLTKITVYSIETQRRSVDCKRDSCGFSSHSGKLYICISCGVKFHHTAGNVSKIERCVANVPEGTVHIEG